MISKNLKNFNLRQIADSGQCFRMIPCAPNDPQTAYRVISGGHFLIVEQNRDEVIFHCPDDELREAEDFNRQERNEYGERKGGCREETEKTERKKRKDRDRVYSGSGSAAWRIFPL